MKHLLSIIVLGWLLLTICFSCLSSRNAKPEPADEKPVTVQTIVPDTFVLPQIPDTMREPVERAKFLVMHYWDRFDFDNRYLVWRPEITEQAFANYINILDHVPQENVDASVVYTLHKTKTDTMVYIHFVNLFEKYLYDSNSPFRNEEYYLPVLQEVTHSSLLTETSRSLYRFQLEMAMKNRVGQKAGDFSYTVASGQSFRLYSLNSEYILLMFTNPGCSTCAAVTEYLRESKQLNDLLSLNNPTHTMITILDLFPDNNPEDWREHLSEIPASWVYAYDKSGEITGKKLYDIRAFPTLYLLDKDKKVILKDTSAEAIELFFSTH